MLHTTTMNRRSVSPSPAHHRHHGAGVLQVHRRQRGGHTGGKPHKRHNFFRWTQIIVVFIALDLLFLFLVNSHHEGENVHEMHANMLKRRQQPQQTDPSLQQTRRNLSEQHPVEGMPGEMEALLHENHIPQQEKIKPTAPAHQEPRMENLLHKNETAAAAAAYDVKLGNSTTNTNTTANNNMTATNATTTTTTTVATTTTTTISLFANMTPQFVPDRPLPHLNRHHDIDRYFGHYMPQHRYPVENLYDAHANNFIRADSIVEDPLRNRFWNHTRRAVTYDIKLPYLGILIDGGRHYYPIRWLERVVDYISAMKYNLIQLRLTDDQAFNVLLDSHPELAYPAAVNNPDRRVWTVPELKHLVHYAKQRNVSIMPEINVPGHGGAWAGIPGLITQCPEYLCNKGYSVPLNVSHPDFLPVLQDVINETLRIFDPPFLHLGGDEVDMGAYIRIAGGGGSHAGAS